MRANLNDILTKDFIERFQDSFAFATGFGVVFTDQQGNHIGSGSNFSPFCQQINKTRHGADCCAHTNRNAIQMAIKTQRPSIYICHAGLVNIEIPLTFEGEYIGAFTAGQVLCSDENAYPKDILSAPYPWLETEDARQKFQQIKVLTKQQIEATAVSLENIANYIIQTAMYNLLQEKLIAEQERRLEYERKQLEMEHQLKLAELDALQKQVTPHFIFNVLSSVSRLISMGSCDSARNILDSFSRMLRYRLSDTTSNITLAQELDYVENYLKIQKHRFSDRLEFEIMCEEEAADLELPWFSLQPLVENAIEHGLLPLEYGGLLKIICRQIGEDVHIQISDDGTGMSTEKMQEVSQRMFGEADSKSNLHVGMRNAYRRLKLLFEDRLDFSVESQPDSGTMVSIWIRRPFIDPAARPIPGAQRLLLG